VQYPVFPKGFEDVLRGNTKHFTGGGDKTIGHLVRVIFAAHKEFDVHPCPEPDLLPYLFAMG